MRTTKKGKKVVVNKGVHKRTVVRHRDPYWNANKWRDQDMAQQRQDAAIERAERASQAAAERSFQASQDADFDRGMRKVRSNTPSWFRDDDD
jgi:hypothetical protein